MPHPRVVVTQKQADLNLSCTQLWQLLLLFWLVGNQRAA